MVGMADGYAQASGRTDGRQPAHRARRRQRDGRDLQRPGQPLAAAGHRRPAGARADHPAGQPHQPRRDPHAAPAGQVDLRAAAGRGRAAGARPRRPPRLAAAARAPSSSRSRWTTGTPRSTTATPRDAIGRTVTGRAVADPEAVRALAERLDAATNPVLVAGPDIDASGGWDAAIALAERQRLPVWASPATGGGRLGFPEGHPNFRGVLPPAIGPVGQTLEGHDLILVVGSSVFPYYPYIPGPLLPEGAELVAITSDPDEAARAPMGDAIVADVKLTLEALLEAVPESSRPAPEPNPGPQEIPPTDPLNASTVHTALGRGPPRGRDRRPRVALQHAGAAQPAAALAPRQLLLRRRRRPRLRPRRRGRRPARPARPAGRLRARRGLGPVRGHRLLERGRLRGAGHLPRPAQQRVRDPQVVRRDRAGRGRPRPRPAGARRRRGRRRLRRRRRPRSSGRDELREALADALASARPELVEVPVAPGMSLF